jgi:hypothetical protein
MQVMKLLWNDQKQSGIRCSIFQDKYDKNGGETLAEHYLKYVNMVAYLHPPLSDYDLLGALTAHYPYDVQKCMISANLKSNQEALSLLGKLQAINEEGKTQRENRGESKPEFRGRENRQTGNDRVETRRGYHNQTVRHITYDRRQNNPQTTHYNRRDARHLGQNYNGRTEVSSRNNRHLDPRVAEFQPSAGDYRTSMVTEPAIRTGDETHHAGNER